MMDSRESQESLESLNLVPQLDKLTDFVPVGILRIDAEGQCVHANRRWLEMSGLSQDQARGSGWLMAVQPSDRKGVVERWRSAAADDREVVDEFRLQGPGGTEVYVSSRCVPVRDARGKRLGQLCASIDITERLQTEQALRRLAEELSERVKELNCLFGISHIREQYADSLPDILQETANLLPPSWEHSDVACARIVLEGREFRTENYATTPWKQASPIFVFGEPSGSVEVCYLQGMPLRDEGPFHREERSLIDAVAERIGRIAERLRAEEVLHEREQDLRERLTHLTRVSLMGEMASSIAHEVSQPLTAIATYAQACVRMLKAASPTDTEFQGALARIIEEALRAGDILHGLKDLVRQHDAKRSRLNVNALVHDVERLASVDARLHDVRLRFELSAPLAPVWVDGIQIQQVLLNLIRNAIDASELAEPERREVVVRTELGSDRDVVVSVIDHGRGLPEGSEHLLFEPFFTTKEGGIGMGLSISRSIVASHGGRMWFESNPDGGVTFCFTIPVAEKEEP